MAMRPVPEAYPVTQSFKQNLTQYNVAGSHGAIDYGTPVGTPIVAPEDGVITFADWCYNLPGGPDQWDVRDFQIKPAYGVTNVGGGIMTRLENELGTKWWFAHLSSNDIAPVGTKVRKGQIIGYTGNTGSSTGPHLHLALIPKYAAWGNGYFGGINPQPYLTERYAPLSTVVDRKTTSDIYLQGIDTSDFQPANIVQKVPASFVIVKTTEGIGWQAKNWKKQLADARAKKLKVGVYHYARPQNDALREAEYFYSVVKSQDSKDLIWFLDWEEKDYYHNTGWASRFMARLDQLTGRTTGLYANTAGLTGGVWAAKDKQRPLWRAFPVLEKTGYATSFNLPPAAAGFTRLVLDQYSFFGRLPGYSGDLDLNVYYGGIPQWGAVGSATTQKEWYEMAELSSGVKSEMLALMREALDIHDDYKRELPGSLMKQPDGTQRKGSRGSVIDWLPHDIKEIKESQALLMQAVTPSRIKAAVEAAGVQGQKIDEKLLAAELIAQVTGRGV